jgi:predicted PolB exonuclease-like 3'-5' exonuclease
MGWPVLVFDIETIPDVTGMRDVGLIGTDQDWPDWQTQRTEAGKPDMAPLHLQRVLVISCVFRNADGLRVRSFVDRDGQGEGSVIQTFFQSIDRHSPQLVSWNGGGFDLPVLHYRGLKHGVEAWRYWDLGDGGDHDSREFKWNNYISRYHTRHLDLMDLLALYQPKNNAPLDAMAKLCGFPGKLGMSGDQVYPAYLRGELDTIRRYCETDVLNTYLLYCRFQKMRGGFTADEYQAEMAFVRQTLQVRADACAAARADDPQAPVAADTHWAEYLAQWA